MIWLVFRRFSSLLIIKKQKNQVELDGNFFTENMRYTKYIYASRDSNDAIRASSVSRSAEKEETIMKDTTALK